MVKFTAAVVQMQSGTSLEANIEKMRDGAREAAASGASYIQTPEMTGLVQQGKKEFFATVKNEVDDPIGPAASALAKELGVTLHVGSTPILLGEGRAANRAYVFGPDGELKAQIR